MTIDSPPSSSQARLSMGEVAVKAYGKYYLVRKLAEGGMAEIFLAKQVGVEGFEKNVVIKRMLPHLSAAPDFVSMFLDEARLAASLTHSNIVQISDLGFADGCYFICMEYLAGEDFATVLRTAKRREEHAPLNVVLRVLTEAAVGLHFAHEAVDPKGEKMFLVHRDVSPSNIFITYSGQVKVLDFGIAKAESRITMTAAGVVKGKYQYMSPEQARGDAIDRRSDIFSLGVSLYEALTGVRPFARDSDLAVLNAVLEGDYKPVRLLRPDLPLEIEQIVNKAMAQDRDQRFPTALAMAQEIEKYVGASTSASGGAVLASFMTGFFGPERVKSKMRIESLDELAERGIDVPGRDNPHSPKTSPGGPADDFRVEETRLMSPPEPRSEAKPPKGLKVLIAAALLVGIAGTVVAMKLFASDSGQVSPQEDIDAGPVEFDAGAFEIDAGRGDAGAIAVSEVEDAGVPILRPQRPVTLTTAMIQRAFSMNKARIQRCFQEHKAELPTPQGTLRVTFAIASSGKVVSASADLPGTKVSACIEAVVRSTVFPRHVDLEVRAPIALNWDVR